MLSICHYPALMLAIVAGTTATAQDQVVLSRGRFAGKIRIAGLIDEYTGTEIRIRLGQGEDVRTYPAAEVIEVVTPQTEAHDQGLARLSAGRVEEAIVALETALKKEPRMWVRREILATLVRCAVRRGDYPAAGTRFLALVKSDPTTRHFRLIPLAWSSEPLSEAALSEGKTWIAGDSEVERLIGASLLLDNPESTSAARGVLHRLATSADRRIQEFAQVQQWRLDLARGNIDKLQVIHWQERVDRLPAGLRAGPSYLLGRAYAARHDYELAAATFLWLPLVDDHDFRLSARAALEAGIALGRIGQQAEARSLFREVTQRFAGTTSADEAAALLETAIGKEHSAEKEVAP